MKLSVEGIFGGITSEGNKRLLGFQTINSLVFESDTPLIEQEFSQKQLLELVNFNLKAYTLKKGREIQIQINRAENNPRTSMEKQKILKIRVSVPNGLE